MTLPETIAGFSVLPVQYSNQVTHIIYARKNITSKKNTNSSLPDGRTLFLVNVPPDATDRELVLFFKPAGIVEKVVWDQRTAQDFGIKGDLSDSSEDEEDASEDGGDTQMAEGATAEPVTKEGTQDVAQSRKRKRGKGTAKVEEPTIKPLPTVEHRILRQTGRTAFVVFLDESSLQRSLSTPHKPRPWPHSSEPTGLARYIAFHDAARPPLDAVREHADSAMEVFDYNEAKRKKRLQSKYKKGESIVDADGFTLVVRGGQNGQTVGGGVAVATRTFEKTGVASVTKKKKKKKELDNFYAFQGHEKRRQGMLPTYRTEKQLTLK